MSKSLDRAHTEGDENLNRIRLREQTALLRGDNSSLNVTCDIDAEGRSGVPLICCSATRGYVHITSFLSDDPRREKITELANWMTESDDGAFVAVTPEAVGRPGVALIQADHGREQGEGFYQRAQGDSHGIWRDFYFTTIFTALREADALWQADEILLAHPVNGAWDLDLMTVALEVIGHLADRQELHVKTIHLDCLHGDRNRMFEQALSTLNREQTSDSKASFREFLVEEVELPSDVGENALDARIWQIPLERVNRSER